MRLRRGQRVAKELRACESSPGGRHALGDLSPRNLSVVARTPFCTDYGHGCVNAIAESIRDPAIRVPWRVQFAQAMLVRHWNSASSLSLLAYSAERLSTGEGTPVCFPNLLRRVGPKRATARLNLQQEEANAGSVQIPSPRLFSAGAVRASFPSPMECQKSSVLRSHHEYALSWSVGSQRNSSST